MKKHNAFTFAEVLLTLIITGVVMTLCVSTVMRATNNHERKVGYHKAINILNNAFEEYFNENSTDYTKTCNGKKIGLTDTCLDASGNPIEATVTKSGSSYTDPVLIGQATMNTDKQLFDRIFKKHLSLIRYETLPSGAKPMRGCPSGATYFYTVDGLRFCYKYGVSSAGRDLFGDTTYGEMWVDINGDQMPNKISIDPGNPGDTFPIVIMKDRFIPGHPTDSEVSRIAQAIFFGEDEANNNN